MLLGGSIGSLVGMGVDAGDAVENASIIEQIAGKLPEGAVALIGLVQEATPAFVDLRLAKFQVAIFRFDAAVVALEVEAARELERQLQKKAREEIRQQKKDAFNQKIEEHRNKMQKQFEELKGKFQK